MPDLKMPNINYIAVSGRLCRDPELKYTATGKAYLKTALAIDDGYGDKKKTYFVDVAYWGEPAEAIYDKLHKGAPLHIEGRLTIEEWEARTDGSKKSRVVIQAHRLNLLAWPDDKPKPTREPQPDTAPAPEDDIPF